MKKEKIWYQVERRYNPNDGEEWCPAASYLEDYLFAAELNLARLKGRSPAGKFRIAKYKRVGVVK